MLCVAMIVNSHNITYVYSIFALESNVQNINAE